MMNEATSSNRRLRLDLRATAMLTVLALMRWPTFHERTPEQARSDFQVLIAGTSRWGAVRRRKDTAATRDGYPAVPIRVYWPLQRDTSAAGTSAVVLWFHGGGFVVGDLFTADSTCRKLAAASRSIVISVDYRRAPESPAPAAYHDAETAALWLLAHAHRLGGDPHRLVVAGDSAGGALAAHAAQYLRDNSPTPAALQVLVYPATDFTLAHADRDPAVAGMLTWATIAWFATHSLRDVDTADPQISPYFVDSCAGLPPAYLVTAGVDPFRSDAVAYANRLTDAGVPVVHRDYPGQVHGFVDMDLVFPAGHRALCGAGAAIRRVAPVDGSAEPASSEPLRWRPTTDRVRRSIHENTIRHPLVNSARMLATLADQQWRHAINVLDPAPSTQHPG